MSKIVGKAKRYNGNPIDYVLIFEWQTGKIIDKVVPAANGNWDYMYYGTLKVGFVYVGDGCEPIAHGPYDFVATDLPIVVNGDFEDGLNGWDNDAGHWTTVLGNAYHATTEIARPITQTFNYVGNAIITIDVTVLKGQIAIVIGSDISKLGVGTHKFVKEMYLSNSVFFTHRDFGFTTEYYVSRVTVEPI